MVVLVVVVVGCGVCSLSWFGEILWILLSLTTITLSSRREAEVEDVDCSVIADSETGKLKIIKISQDSIRGVLSRCLVEEDDARACQLILEVLNTGDPAEAIESMKILIAGS